VADAAAQDPRLAGFQPQVRYDGFARDGYSLDERARTWARCAMR
jgi:hypothetical protein